MRKTLTRFFNNDTVFFVFTLIVAVSSAIFVAYYCAEDFNPMAILIALLFAGCAITLYISYKKHDKNVMKGMLGAILMACLYFSINELKYAETAFQYIISGIYILGCLAFFINHFIINSSHLSRPKNVLFSEILCIGCFVLDIIWNVWYFLGDRSAWAFWDYTWYVVDVFNTLAILGVIVCVQQKLDLHRITREENGYVPPEK